LSDEADFDYTQRLRPGTTVIGMITKIEVAQNDSSAPPRLHMSLRESVVKYGLQDGKASKKAKEGDMVSAIVLATAQDKVFGQIIGSISKIKIKGMDNKANVKSLVKVKVTQVEGWKIKGDFVGQDDEVHIDKSHNDFISNLWQTVSQI
jgi:hypothetical protein